MIRKLILNLQLVAFALIPPVSLHAASTKRTSASVCTLNAFLAQAEIASAKNLLHWTGSGLLSCQIGFSGFSSETPVYAELEATPKSMRILSDPFTISVQSAPFILDHEMDHFADLYSYLETPDTTSKRSDQATQLLFRGERHRALIAMNLSSLFASLKDMSIHSLLLKFDESTATIDEPIAK